MLTDKIDWQKLRSDFEYVPSDSQAYVRDGNGFRLHDVLLNAATNEPFIKDGDRLIPVSEVRGFQRFEKIKVPVKRMYDPMRGEVVEVSVSQ